MKWADVGLRAPDKANADKAEYRKDEDTLGRFILECLDAVEAAPRAIGRGAQEIYVQYRYCTGQRPCRHEPEDPHRPAQGSRYDYDDSSHTWRGFPGLQVRMGLTESD
jgi:hypothetical protein